MPMVAKFTISGYIGEYDEQMEALLSGTGVTAQGGGNYTSAAMLRNFFEQEAPDAESYEITFKSPGGDVAEGFEMYDLICAQSKPVTAIGLEVQSVATIPFLACNERKMVKGGTFMIHNAWIDPRSLGDIQLNVQNLDQIKKLAQNATDKLLAVYLNRSGHAAIDRIKNLMEQEAALGAGELQSLGFVTEIIDGQAAKPARALAFDKSIINLTQQAMSEERLSGIERALKSLKALLNLSAKAMVLQVPNGPQLYVFSEDGEFAGKKAVIAENGEPTETPAPAGTHALEDGREIVVGEGGIISEVREAAAEGMSEEEMQAAIAAEKEKMQAALEEEKKAMVEEKEQAINALKAEFTEKVQALEAQVKALASEVPGDGKYNESQEVEDFAKLTPVQRILRVKAMNNN